MAILSLVLLYELHTIDRFPSVGDFLSYARLVTPKLTSDGKVTGQSGAKIGNVHLKWAFSEAVLWMLRYSDQAKALVKCKEKKYGKPRAMTMLARKIARAVYYMLKQKEPFDAVKFFASYSEASGGAARTNSGPLWWPEAISIDISICQCGNLLCWIGQLSALAT